MRTIRKRIMRQSNPKKTIATVTFHGRSHKEAARNARAFAKKFHLPFEADVNPIKRNVAAGFYDEDGIFHPIQTSFDYSEKRARAKSRREAREKSRRKRKR